MDSDTPLPPAMLRDNSILERYQSARLSHRLPAWFHLLCVVALTSLALGNARLATAAETDVAGTLAVRIVDYNGHAEKEYFVRTDEGTEFKLDVSEAKAPERLLLTGAHVVVGGEYVNGTLVASDVQFTRLAQASLSGVRPVTGARKVAVVLVNFSDRALSCTATQLDALLFTNTRSVRAVYEQSSRNNLTLTRDTDADGSADIFGPYTIGALSTVCDYSAWETGAKSAAQSAGVNLSAYQHVILVLAENSCSWSGLGDYLCGNDCTVWAKGCTSPNTYAHELGHNFGMDHASAPLLSGTWNEYSDGSCPMGNSEDRVIFNAPHISQLGWFDNTTGSVQTVTTSGTYTVTALESDATSLLYPQLLRLTRQGSDDYYVSFRRNLGTFQQLASEYDSMLSIHSFNSSQANAKTYLHKTLQASESYSDSTVPVTIGLLSQTDTTAEVLVNMGSGAPTDADGDGVPDYQETIDGSDSTDPGSHLNHLASPTYLLWNSFLGMTNIAEFINSGTEDTTITVSLYAIDGTLQHTASFVVAPAQQRDLILNELPGFAAESYGLFKVEFTRAIDGRMSYYRQSASGYDFAYSIPFAQPLYGASAAGFNTFQPSTNPGDAAEPVFNWITLVNLAGTTKTFTVYSYDQAGQAIATRALAVPSSGRVDVDGGHALLGANVVGTHRIVPDDSSSPYIAQLIRYGASGADYKFAFPLSFRAGTGQALVMPISRQFTDDDITETTWVEVVNTKNAPVGVTMIFRNSAGGASTMGTTLPPYGQLHLEAAAYGLETGDIGQAVIVPEVANSLIAQAMSYTRANATGSIEAMFGIPGREILGAQLNGSFNTYLDQENWIHLSNTSGAALSVTVSAVLSADSNSATTRTLPAHSSLRLNLGAPVTLGLAANSYGRIIVDSDRSKALVASLVRARRRSAGLDYAFPTEIRAE